MEIILKQPDIEKAIRQYIGHQGISLRNKTMSIDFTSGRGGNGLSAAIHIDDVEIPGFTLPDAVYVDPVADTAVVLMTPATDATIRGNTPDVAVVDEVEEDKPKKEAILPGGGEIKSVGTVLGLIPAVAVVEEVAVAVAVQTDTPVTATVVTAAPITTAAEAVAATKESAATALLATQETEAAKAEPIAEAKVAEAAPLFAAEAQATLQPQVEVEKPAKTTSSLFG
jgi:hypothetical protein